MKSNRVRFLALAMLTACPCFPASILLSGNSMPNTLTLAGNLGKLDGNSYTFVDTSLFAGISLSGYDLVWLDGFSQYVDLSSLTPYLNAGGRVLVQNPGFGSEPLSAYPGGAALSAIFESKDSVRIVAPDDFLNLGLTNDGLSGWGPSAYGFFSTVSQGFLVLTDDGTSGESITIRQSSGPGTLVYTQQGAQPVSIQQRCRTRLAPAAISGESDRSAGARCGGVAYDSAGITGLTAKEITLFKAAPCRTHHSTVTHHATVKRCRICCGFSNSSASAIAKSSAEISLPPFSSVIS